VGEKWKDEKRPNEEIMLQWVEAADIPAPKRSAAVNIVRM
jgi:hypothetical protein